MTGKRPTPLKDELVTSPDELQELFAANLAATEALNRKLCGHSDTKPIDTEALKTAVATAARNAVKELLEERQRGFEREEKETKARGRLTPQECYERMAADFAEALDKYKLICDAFGHIVRLADRLDKTRDSYDTRVRLLDAKLDIVVERLGGHAAAAKKPTFPARPERFKEVFAYLFRDMPLYCLRRAVLFPPHAAVRMDMPALSLAADRRNRLFYRARQRRVAERNATEYATIKYTQ